MSVGVVGEARRVGRRGAQRGEINDGRAGGRGEDQGHWDRVY